MCDENGSSIDLKQSMALAESLAKISLMTSSAMKKRLAARNMEIKFGHLDEEGGFVPPKEFLMYLVRMGSFSSTPKILNDDSQDNELQIPIDFSRFELLQYCQKQPPMVQPMVKRTFRKAVSTKIDKSEFHLNYKKLNILTKGCSDYISSPFTLRVFQWNILSQALGQMNDNFVRCPDEALEWDSRKFRIIEEILEYCPDIICLQEVDHFNFLKYILGTQGYTGVFYPKPDSPCMYITGNNGPDGCAIFYRTDKFEVINIETRILEIWRVQSNQVALLANLRVKSTGQELSVTTTHLKARQGAFLSTLRNEQGKDLLQFVTSHAAGRPIILCGDFNAEPCEPIYSTLLAAPFRSAYADADLKNSEPPYTTWKIRDEGEVCHTIDYVFYQRRGLEVDAVLELPTAEQIGIDRVPSFAYPSDHFSLVCDFRIKEMS